MEWRKASFCQGGECVQAHGDWRKASRSCSNGGNCVEARAGDVVLVRDGKDRLGPRLSFSRAAWAAFTSAVRAGAHG